MARSVSLFAERAGRVLRRPVPRGPKKGPVRPAQLMEAIENALVSPPATFPRTLSSRRIEHTGVALRAGPPPCRVA